MTMRLSLVSLFTITLFMLVGAACSSIPDVVYDDQLDAASSGSSGSSGSSSGSAGRDSGNVFDGSSGASGSSGNSSGNPNGYNCTNNVPPPNVGICCGGRLCIKCNAGQCDRCQKEECSQNGQACCANNPGSGGSSISCKSPSSCLD